MGTKCVPKQNLKISYAVVKEEQLDYFGVADDLMTTHKSRIEMLNKLKTI